MTPSPPHPAPRAFIGAEALVSLASVAIVILALAAGLSISVRAAQAAPADADFSAAATAVERLAAELSTAHLITELDANAIEFVADDITGDLRPDLVRYEWSGTPGAPLTRSINDASAAIVIDEIADLTLSATNAAAEVGPSITLRTAVNTAFRLAKSRKLKDMGDDTRLLFTTDPATSARTLFPGQAIRQSFDLTGSSNTNVSISRLRIRATQAGAIDGTLTIRFAKIPENRSDPVNVLFKAELNERQIAGHGFDWVTLDIANAESVELKDLCVEIVAGGPDPDEPAARLLVTNTPESDSGRTESPDASTFNPASGTLAFELYGATTSSEGKIDESLRSVRVKLAVPASPGKLIDTTIYLNNTEIPK